jgi:hypothetical protein
MLQSVVALIRSTSSSATLVVRWDLDLTSLTGTLSCTCPFVFIEPRVLDPRIYLSERYYSIFDTANGRVGFASTAHTNATTN